VSDTSVDIAMMLRDVMTSKRMRSGWGPELAWAYPGVPASVVGELAGYPAAGVPFVTPETATVDHGSVYKNHHLIQAQRVLGVNILPARVLRPTDKHAAERTFAGVQSLLFELLPGWQGIDVADRRVDPEADAVLSIAEVEHLFATFIASVWQLRALGEYAPAWDPGGTHSPNSLFAASMLQGGAALQVPPPHLYYQLLPASHVKIHGRRGVKVRGLWYDGPVLDSYRHELSARGGAHKGRWLVHYDRRDARYVFFCDPADQAWHRLDWVGLPAHGEVPAFGDASREQLLRVVRERGFVPRSDTELLPVLLDLLGGAAPVDSWPGQQGARQRCRRAREITAAHTASMDRGDTRPAAKAASDEPGSAVVGLAGRTSQVRAAVDEQRRVRRQRAVPQPPALPPRLGTQVRQRSRLLLASNEVTAAGGEDQ
jgi:hypothetical protein